MLYTSTRGKCAVSAAQAIVNGIAADGGLYVPETFPTFTKEDFDRFSAMDYPARAAFVLNKFMDDFSVEELTEYARKAYSRFDGEPAPLCKLQDGSFMLELWHGPTLAFKDMALTLLPYLITAARRKTGAEDKTLILVATSGDTGKAALEGFKDVENTEIIVFYPDQGVSKMQRLQMVTQTGSNVHVAAIKGNFDDAQSAVKTIFTSADCIGAIKKKGYSLSSANSINWGRLAPQIVYYISAYADLVESGEIEYGDKVNFTVPSGNFGNILAAYYAKRMGLPVGRLICASNINNVLTDFFNEGRYDTDREFFKTKSPSMDILISSNLERLLFEMSGRDEKFVARKMAELKENKAYSVDKKTVDACGFAAGFADEEETRETTFNFFELNDYALDPHTAVAAAVYSDYLAGTGDAAPCVIVSTASPYKFPQDVYFALTDSYEEDPFKAAEKLYEYTALELPESIGNLKNSPVLHPDVVDKEDIFGTVIKFISKE